MNSKKASLASLDKEIIKWKLVILSYSIFLVVAYVLWFFLKARPLSLEPEQWGQFGDFIGGLLNPVVALAALFWLTKSIRYQKEEIMSATDSLNTASEAGRDQALAMSRSAEINALAALISSVTSEINEKRLYANIIAEQLHINAEGRSTRMVITAEGVEMSSGAGREHLKKVAADIKTLVASRDVLKQDVERIRETFKKDSQIQ